MPKISIYVPDALYDEIRRREIPLSAVAQRAFENAIRGDANADWVARARTRPPRTHHAIDVEALMDDVRDEFGR